MDTLLLHSQSSMASPKPKLKRPCCSPSLPSPDNQNHIPSSSSNFPWIDDMDSLLESILAVSDSSTVALNCSFDRLLDYRACDSEKADMIDRALKFGSVLLEAAKRSARKRSLLHNAVVWALPPDLTIKVLFRYSLFFVPFSSFFFEFLASFVLASVVVATLWLCPAAFFVVICCQNCRLCGTFHKFVPVN